MSSVLAIVAVMLQSAASVKLLVGQAPNTDVFFASYAPSQPVLLVAPTAAFDNPTAQISSVTVTMSPAGDPSVEGVSFSTFG